MKNINLRVPYRHWRWWLAIIFLWPMVLLAVFMIFMQKALIFIGEMFIYAGRSIKSFNPPFLSRALDFLNDWIFKE